MLSILFHYSLLQNIACSALCYTVVLVGCLFYTCYCVSVNPRGCCYLGPQGPCPSAMASWYRLPFPFLPHPLQLAVIISHPISLDRLFPKNACQWCSPPRVALGGGVTAESTSLSGGCTCPEQDHWSLCQQIRPACRPGESQQVPGDRPWCLPLSSQSFTVRDLGTY